MKYTRVVIPLAVSALLAPTISTPAMADTTDLSDPSSVLSQNFSQFLNRSDNAGEVTERASARGVAEQSSALTVDPAVNEVPAFKVGTGSKDKTGSEDGYTVLSDPDSSAAQYIRADAAGATIVSAVESSNSLGSMEFELEDGVKSTAKADTDTPYIFLENGEQVALRAPTVKDANGKTLNASLGVS